MGLHEPPELVEFRHEVRQFLAQQLPADLRNKMTLGLKLEKADQVRWFKLLRVKGWLAGWWPKEYGGRGWSAAQRLAFSQELALGCAPSVHSQALNLIGPVLYTFGSEVQKQQHLPRILAAETWWCQGFSEPNSGSDLASLQTRAVRAQGFYVVSGTKMWTSEAHLADMMYCLVRTSTGSAPQKGISLLLIDMRSPGITVRPILTLDGLHRTNQVFLDDIRVPADNLVGAEGQGWAIAKFLLRSERMNLADISTKVQLLRKLRLRLQVVATGDDVQPAVHELWRTRITDLEIQLLGLRQMERQLLEQLARDDESGVLPFMLKIRATEIMQALTELEAEMQGPYTAAYDPADVLRSPENVFTEPQLASLATHRYLYSRCWSIFGGTNEIQRNIIAKHVFGS